MLARNAPQPVNARGAAGGTIGRPNSVNVGSPTSTHDGEALTASKTEFVSGSAAQGVITARNVRASSPLREWRGRRYSPGLLFDRGRAEALKKSSGQPPPVVERASPSPRSAALRQPSTCGGRMYRPHRACSHAKPGPSPNGSIQLARCGSGRGPSWARVGLRVPALRGLARALRGTGVQGRG